MDSLKDTITHIRRNFDSALHQATHAQDIENIRVQFLGKKGLLPALNDELKTLSLEQKREIGPQVQELRLYVEKSLLNALENLKNAEIAAKIMQDRFFDVTLSRPLDRHGSMHILTLVTQELEDIFSAMGFETVDGPELENDWYNFTALNIPQNHPARDAHDTFWIDGVPGALMRTHTSTIQIHTMKKRKPPFAIFAAGRVFRNEATDASHDFMFMQGEPLLIDKGISMANLLSCAQNFLKAFFNKSDLKIRVRPSYFPFVEPGVEIDASCVFCTAGCSVCKRTGWIELAGAGMVHPNVLKACDIDPNVYSGFAMGFGISRLAMLKYGITDVRLLNSTKINVLKSFNRII